MCGAGGVVCGIGDKLHCSRLGSIRLSWCRIGGGLSSRGSRSWYGCCG